MTSIDYDTHANLSMDFYATVQNKLHWAVHKHTAAELIKNRVSVEKQNMGLTTWKGEKIRKADVTIAKNYLSEDELKQLNLLMLHWQQWIIFLISWLRKKKLILMVTTWNQK